MAMLISPRRAGHVVALEGPSDLVATQLRLLPTSRQILILPSLQHYLQDSNPEAPVDPCELIRQYHTASQARHAEAQEFLRPSTPTDEKRVVFMHGSTMSAQLTCLSTIMEHETEGDIEEAHATYIWLASNGVAGLSTPARLSCPRAYVSPPESAERDAEKRSSTSSMSATSSEEPDPLDPLDQPDQPDQQERYVESGNDPVGDCIIRAMRAAEALDKETEFLQPVTPDVDLTVKLVDIPSRSKKRLSSTVAEAPELLRGSRTPCPREVQARLSTERVPRVSSATAPTEEPASAALRKPALRIRIPPPRTPRAADAAHVAARQPLPRVDHKKTPSNNAATQDDTPRPSTPDSALLVLHQGGRGIPAEPEVLRTIESEEEQPFEPVLPVLEDLVVYFKPATPSELHDFVFRRLSEGCKGPRAPISGSVLHRHDGFHGGETSHLEMEEDHDEDEDDNDAVSPWTRQDLVHGLPTPNHSPTLLGAASVVLPVPNTRLYSISVGEETAVSIQNYLRSFLGSQLPLQGRRYSTPDGLAFSAEAGLWRALECDGQLASSDGEPRLDLILAVGAESGVKKNRLSEVVGQLDQLGFKTSGLSRSGRLDIRYLIANAMQAFTAQPLTKQTQSNPFVDRALLAALIIPHLETYLATHLDVRFLLIEYPSEHLPTVIALQTLIGTEMMKVVGIINSDISSPLPSRLVPETDRRPSEGFRSLNRRESRTSGAFVGPCSFSKGNFLLASSATGFERAAFVAAIRESLISISDFYIPDRALYKPRSAPSLPKKPYPALTITTKPTTRPSPPQTKKEPLPLLITPPSSPSFPQNQPSTTLSTPPPTRAPRSTTTITTPSKTGPSTATATTGRIRWGEVNYAPSTTLTASSTYSSDTSTSSSSNNSNSNKDSAAAAHPHHHHRHKDSDPLSPRATAPVKKEVAAANGVGHVIVGVVEKKLENKHVEARQKEEEEDDDEDDEDALDAEERRLMGLYWRRSRQEMVGRDRDRGGSSKALRWLGLV